MKTERPWLYFMVFCIWVWCLDSCERDGRVSRNIERIEYQVQQLHDSLILKPKK